MSEPSNAVAEWFGHRVFPTVEHADAAYEDQRLERCPFLTEAIGEETPCVKSKNSKGVCTISSISNGERQDWLVCPFRAFSDDMLQSVVNYLFGADDHGIRVVVPATTLQRESVQESICKAIKHGDRAIVYFQNKLGGEISIRGTDRSPEFSLDITLAEIIEDKGRLDVGGFGIWEVQTMDFHGSYRHAVDNLRDALRLHKQNFHSALEDNPEWAAKRIEGPNKANVVKRTFYQMVFKFEVATHQDCVGCVLSVPEAVWDSWQPHLGKPDLIARGGTDYELREPVYELDITSPTSIFVFKPDLSSSATPRPLLIEKRITTDTDSFSHFAFKVAPESAVGEGGTVNLIPRRILSRIRQQWPGFGQGEI